MDSFDGNNGWLGRTATPKRVETQSFCLRRGRAVAPFGVRTGDAGQLRRGGGAEHRAHGLGQRRVRFDLLRHEKSRRFGTDFSAWDNVCCQRFKKYRLPLDVGQRQNVYFDVQSDGTRVDGQPVKARRIEFLAQGLERPSANEQPFETRIWSKAPNNKPYTPRLLAVQYRYALGANQQSMELNMGNLRHDPESQLKVQGKVLAPTLLLRAAAGQTFVFAPKAASLDAGDRVPPDATFAKEYRIQMAPGQEKALNFWMAEGGHVRPQRLTVQYSVAP